MNSRRSSGFVQPVTGSQPPGWFAAVWESTTSRPSRTRKIIFERGNIDITSGAAWEPATSLRKRSGSSVSKRSAVRSRNRWNRTSIIRRTSGRQASAYFSEKK